MLCRLKEGKRNGAAEINPVMDGIKLEIHSRVNKMCERMVLFLPPFIVFLSPPKEIDQTMFV